MNAHCGEASNLISKPLGLDDCHLLCHSLVGVEIKSEPVVIFLNNNAGGLLHSLGSDATLGKQTGRETQTVPQLAEP